MEWALIQNKILNNIIVGLDVNTSNSTNRNIIQAPPYACTTYNYNRSEGFKVQIGLSASIEIPLFMLKKVYEESYLNNQIYDATVFIRHFGQQYINHGCHIHVVGQIFVKSNIAIQQDKRTYKII
jgi:hypothetical protein